jgi:hypothetical protein
VVAVTVMASVASVTAVHVVTSTGASVIVVAAVFTTRVPNLNLAN